MDNEEIPCMQSQQSNAHNHGRYNNSAHEGRAVTETSPAPIHHQQLSINGPSSPTMSGTWPLWIFSLDLTSRPYQHFHN